MILVVVTLGSHIVVASIMRICLTLPVELQAQSSCQETNAHEPNHAFFQETEVISIQGDMHSETRKPTWQRSSQI